VIREEQLRALGGKIAPRLDAERVASVRVALDRRRRRRVALAVLAGCALVVSVLALIGVRMMGPGAAGVAGSQATTSSVPARSTAPTSATPLVAGTDLSPGPEVDGRSFVLRAGKARFVVAHDEAHPFRVRAGSLLIEDLGTVFTVAVTPDGAVAVEVQEGSVRVRRGSTAIDVATGQRRDFPADAQGSAQAADDAGAGEPAPSGPTTAPTVAPWRRLAESGRYDDAYNALQAAGSSAVRDDTAELLLAADAARLGGHPADAVPYLERVVRGHGRDPRASLAAFTLGRVLLDELGRPAEAADAFAHARGAGGALAEDALAREVEAFSRAGDSTRARELALEYMRAYPKGRRAPAVAKFGGLGGSP
jgi:transmembrane sensor